MDRQHDRHPDRWSIDDIKREYKRYSELINNSDRAPTTKATYTTHAWRFIQWLAGDINI
jgi:hypothetical protein